MKVAKLVVGILCILLSVLVLLQSCVAGLSNVLEESQEVSGSAGVAVALVLLAGGIVMIATRKSAGKAGSIAAMVLFLLGGLIGLLLAGSYKDLNIWAGLCLVLAVLNLVCLFLKPKKAE